MLPPMVQCLLRQELLGAILGESEASLVRGIAECKLEEQ